jgi:Family of unknown function (DUF6527)
MKQERLTHEFVESFPEELEQGTLYVSMPYATVAHKCCCGCGNDVITPLSPTDWKLIFDGRKITLDPSIGNWSFPCRSHYWIEGGRVQWSSQWSQKEIAAGRVHDRFKKEQYFGDRAPALENNSRRETKGSATAVITPSLWARLRKRLGF